MQKLLIKDIVEDFRDYLKSENIDEDYIYYGDVNEYLSLMYFDIFDNVDTEEEREAAEEYIERVIYANFKVECNLSEWEFEIKKQSEKILKNLKFEAVKISDDKTSVYLKDRNSDFYCWFDLWYNEEFDEWDGDWNKYIFFKDNLKDMVQQKVQENCEAFEQAFEIAVEKIREIWRK